VILKVSGSPAVKREEKRPGFVSRRLRKDMGVIISAAVDFKVKGRAISVCP
jgi:hypothetical protein